MLKKVLSMVLAFAMLAVACVLFASCGNKTSDFKIGVICLHDETSTYDLNFINAIEGAQKALGLSDDQVIIIKNVPEGNECLDAAKDLVDQGCKVIFADSFGHESFMIQAAKTYPLVSYTHLTLPTKA